ncbi:MAG: ABC-type transport auxiliary lipoprotein family protein [bacterium]
MKKFFLSTGYLGLLVFSIHCGSVPPTFYYRIHYEVPESEIRNSIVPVTLGISQFTADILYEGDRIVYRQSSFEVQYYHYRRWIAPPKKIVTEKVLEQLRASGIFQRVVRIPSNFSIDFILKGQIKAFEEWDEKSAWYGLVTLSFQLQSAGNNEIVWEKEISEKTRAYKKEPVEVVKAISQSLKKVIEKAILEIEQNIKSLSVG